MLDKNPLGRRHFLKRLGAAAAALAATRFNLRHALSQDIVSYCHQTRDRVLAEFDVFKPKPEWVFQVPVCLYILSKNMNGEVNPEPLNSPICEDVLMGGECSTLQTIEYFNGELVSHQLCDSELSARDFDGAFESTLAVTYINDGTGRGYHTGAFEWSLQGGGVVRGIMSGITNAGTHRDPLMNCETCDTVGHMEGRLEGTVAVEGDLDGCCIFASYAIKFDSTSDGALGAFDATLEGVIMRDCEM